MLSIIGGITVLCFIVIAIVFYEVSIAIAAAVLSGLALICVSPIIIGLGIGVLIYLSPLLLIAGLVYLAVRT